MSQNYLMKKILLTALLVIGYYGSATGQAPSPTPLPADDTDVVKITTAVIQLDLTVTDRKGRVVADLRPDEIEVFENGEKQKVTGFSFVSNVRDRSERANNKNEKPVVLPSSPIRPDQVRRTIAVIIDDLTLSFESMYYARRALRKFVDEQMQDGDLVAIIRTGAGIGALQQFTSDRRQLYAAIERVKWNPIGSGQMGAFDPLQPTVDTGVPERGPESGERTIDGARRENEDFRESVFATGTLGAISYVVRGMETLPGRKSIMLLSDGFRLFTEEATGFRETGRVMNHVRALVERANRASVVIYTMDGRGLQYTGLTAADSTGGRSRGQIQQEISRRRDRLNDNQEGLRYLAEQTGGISIRNSNDLVGGIRKILDDQSYYLIAYEPDEATFDPRTRRFNKLEIKVSRPGTEVRYRSGFFGVTDENIIRPVRQTPAERLRTALTSPFAMNEIALSLNALFYNSTKDGNFIRSLVHVRAQDLKFTEEPNGGKKVMFDVIAIGFGENGIPVDQMSKAHTMVLTKDAVHAVMKHGFVYDFSFPIRKPGAYQLRVAFRDHLTDKLGSANQFVEVPDLKKRRLVLSGVVLENVELAEWQRRNSGGQPLGTSDPLTDTSLRQFKRGTVMNYGFSIYNAKVTGGRPDLSYQTRVFRDGKPIFEGRSQPVVVTNPNAPDFTSSLAIGSEMVPGDYVLQIVVTDNNAGGKNSSATQFVEFEIIQ